MAILDLGGVPLSTPLDRAQRVSEQLGITFDKSVVYLMTRKMLTPSEAKEVNFNLPATRQHEVKRGYLDCSRYARNPDLFLKRLEHRMECTSAHEIWAVKKLDKFVFLGGNELPLAVMQVMRRADIRWMPKTLSIGKRLAHLHDEMETFMVLFVDLDDFGQSYEIFELMNSYGCWLANPVNFKIPDIVELNGEAVKKHLKVEIAEKAEKFNKNEQWEKEELEKKLEQYPRVMRTEVQLVGMDLERSDILIFKITTPWLDQWRHMTRNVRSISISGNGAVTKIKNGEFAGYITGGGCIHCHLGTPESEHLNGICKLQTQHKKYLRCPFCTKSHQMLDCRIVRAHVNRATFRRDWDTFSFDSCDKSVRKRRTDWASNNNDNSSGRSGYRGRYNSRGGSYNSRGSYSNYNDNYNYNNNNYNNYRGGYGSYNSRGSYRGGYGSYSNSRGGYDSYRGDNNPPGNGNNSSNHSENRPSESGSKTKDKKKGN